MALGVAGNERARVGDSDVIAQDAGDRVDEGTFAIRPGAVRKEERVLSREASAAVSDIALQEALQLRIAGRDPIKKRAPLRVWRAGSRGAAGRRLCHVVERIRRT